jgi:hypothetical protein
MLDTQCSQGVQLNIPWPPPHPRVLLASCMKDEGPFILDWLA